MAVNANDPVTGYPIFYDTEGVELGVDQTAIAEYAASVGNHLRGTTAERLAYAYGREGLFWSDTDLDTVFYHSGTGWLAAYTVPAPAAISLNTGWALSFGGAYLNGPYIVVQATFTKNVAIVSGELVCTLPVGYRPAAEVVAGASLHGVAAYVPAVSSVVLNGQLKTYFSGTSSETKLSVNFTFLRP